MQSLFPNPNFYGERFGGTFLDSRPLAFISVQSDERMVPGVCLCGGLGKGGGFRCCGNPELSPDLTNSCKRLNVPHAIWWWLMFSPSFFPTNRYIGHSSKCRLQKDSESSLGNVYCFRASKCILVEMGRINPLSLIYLSGGSAHEKDSIGTKKINFPSLKYPFALVPQCEWKAQTYMNEWKSTGLDKQLTCLNTDIRSEKT